MFMHAPGLGAVMCLQNRACFRRILRSRVHCIADRRVDALLQAQWRYAESRSRAHDNGRAAAPARSHRLAPIVCPAREPSPQLVAYK